MCGTHDPYPVRKPANHTPPFCVAASGAFYFVTICASGHRPWTMAATAATPPLDAVAPLILNEAREYHVHRIWQLSLFLVMPDHLHMLVRIPDTTAGRRAMPDVVARFKHLVSKRHHIAFQRGFFDTRMRDDEHYAEKWRYICANPVTRGLVAVPRDWPHVIAFDRATGEERPHR